MHYGNTFTFSMTDTYNAVFKIWLIVLFFKFFKHPNTEVSYFLYMSENTDWFAAIGK